MEQAEPTGISPVAGAITVGLSVFIGTMSIFVAILAFAVAGRQTHPHAGLALNWSDLAATRTAYGVAGASVVNCFIAFGRARLNVAVTVLSTSVFVVTVFLVNVLFVRAW
jgi:hypothetical protein